MAISCFFILLFIWLNENINKKKKKKQQFIFEKTTKNVKDARSWPVPINVHTNTHTHIFTVSRAKDACSLKESKIKKLNIPYGKIHITTTTTSTTKNTSK